jgi:hyperosmotically inducible periplasmic protein
MKTVCLAILAIAIGGGSATRTSATDPSTKGKVAESAPDDTGRSVRDRGETLTSGDQSETEADRTLTQKIRQAVMADDSLSMTAHNIKIITVDGVVTLRGPVKSDDERQKIAAEADQVAGAGKVQNHLEVAK